MSFYQIETISKEFIPDNIFIPLNKHDDNDDIIKITFSTGLEYYVNSNNLIKNPNDIIKLLSKSFNIFKFLKSPDDIQNYFYYTKNKFVIYSDCKKLYSYYTENYQKIMDTLYVYNIYRELSQLMAS